MKNISKFCLLLFSATLFGQDFYGKVEYQTIQNKSKKELNVVLVGAPNSGKTTLYNWLTGSKHKTVNYPGATIEFSKGELKFVVLGVVAIFNIRVLLLSHSRL